MTTEAASIPTAECSATEKAASLPASIATTRRNRRAIANFYSSLHSPRRDNKAELFKNSVRNSNINHPTTSSDRICDRSNGPATPTAETSKYQKRIISDFNVTAISSSTVTPSDYVINNPHVLNSLKPNGIPSLSTPQLFQTTRDNDAAMEDSCVVGNNDGTFNKKAKGRSTSAVLNTRTIDIQISSFSPLSRRIKADPQFIAIHAGIPSEAEYEESLAKQFENENENPDYTSVDATPPDPNSPYWIPVASLTCLPAVIRLPVTARHLRLSFHTTKPSKYIGEAIVPIYGIVKSSTFVAAPIKYKVTSKQATAVIFLRCSTISKMNQVLRETNKSSSSDGTTSENSHCNSAVSNRGASSLNRAGLSLVSKIAPSMIRESRNVCALVLSVVLNKNHNDKVKKNAAVNNVNLVNNGKNNTLTHPMNQVKKEYSWPVGRISIGKKLDRSGCISAPSDVIWFGIPDTEEDLVLKIEWMGAPKKGLTFVHGELFLQVNQLSNLKKDELFTITWVETPQSVPVNRSVQVEDVSLHDGYWFIDFSLTR